MAIDVVNPVFGINSFNKPKKMSPKESYIMDIMMLLFGKPGFYPSIPRLGINISKFLYQFDDEIDVDFIKTELITQCEDLSIVVDTNDFEIVQTEYEGNLMLVLVMPVINDKEDERHLLTIGITTNENKEIVFNFTEQFDTIYQV